LNESVHLESTAIYPLDELFLPHIKADHIERQKKGPTVGGRWGLTDIAL
jgi:hypothetical protein